MIPEVAGKLSYAFSLGFFAPAVLMTLSLAFYDGLLLHYAGPDGKPLDVATLAAVVFLGSTGLAVLLLAVNFFFIQVLEGVSGMPARLARRRRNHWVRQFRRLNEQIAELRAKGTTISVDEAYRLEQQLHLTFPHIEAAIRPTRLGNVIAAWENYPYRRYRIDAIVLWSRLTPVLSKSVVDAIAGTKAKFDLFMNVLILLPVWGLLHATVLRQATEVWRPLWLLALSVALIPVAWRACIASAIAWGETVKAAFDLHRLDVLQQMGVADCLGPLSAEQERAVWSEVIWPMKYIHLPAIHVEPRRPGAISKAKESESDAAHK